MEMPDSVIGIMEGVVALQATYGVVSTIVIYVRAFVMFITFGYLRLRRRRYYRNKSQYIIMSNVTRRDEATQLVNMSLNTLLKLHSVLLVTPQHVPENCTDSRWKYFKICRVIEIGKRIISVNVLVVCDQNMNYIYVLSRWEGSAADSRVLCDAVTRTHGLKVNVVSDHTANKAEEGDDRRRQPDGLYNDHSLQLVYTSHVGDRPMSKQEEMT
ncbi:hypothetical protein ACS0TY_011436 [Phlomoides rotata]